MSNDWQDIMSGVQHASTQEQLEEFIVKAEAYESYSNQRVKTLRQHVQRRLELMVAKDVSVEEKLKEVADLTVTSEESLDF